MNVRLRNIRYCIIVETDSFGTRRKIVMDHFHRLAELTGARVAEDLAMAIWPVADGAFVQAAVLRIGPGQSRLHRQPRHEELLVVLAGEALFRVGEKVRHVCPGDIIFVPRDHLHGLIELKTGSITLLSAISPTIDLKRDVVYEDAGQARSAELP